ncbi:helix-turn-helix domain-containing protein [Hoeflea sp. WL0058]|uniref:Helix-turn-helix domain-containing protein n=1 Tax=Flavimaribacter sediminis TaxID=2865987 RepID=A0AAE2ZH75_9HYPH|nr:helix-turn-helix transcriptional regulator [Flavimaribacter sediminis]MBW8636221.1 helix-turn-helix domain-containing protein [Flavimaribacter sediminis]
MFLNDAKGIIIGHYSQFRFLEWMLITTEQIKAARMMVGWSQAQLSEYSGVPHSTLKRIESKKGPLQANARTAWTIQETLEKAGILFLSADDEAGAGVRLAIGYREE